MTRRRGGAEKDAEISGGKTWPQEWGHGSLKGRSTHQGPEETESELRSDWQAEARPTTDGFPERTHEKVKG